MLQSVKPSAREHPSQILALLRMGVQSTLSLMLVDKLLLDVQPFYLPSYMEKNTSGTKLVEGVATSMCILTTTANSSSLKGQGLRENDLSPQRNSILSKLRASESLFFQQYHFVDSSFRMFLSLFVHYFVYLFSNSGKDSYFM